MSKANKNDSTWRIVRPPLHPRFDMPTRKELFDVFEGDEVKLIFEDDEGNGERMWVTVTSCATSDYWEGRLANDPIGNYTKPRLKYGAKIKFHPYNVIGINLIRLKDEATPWLKPEQVSIGNINNDIKRKWYKDPQHIVPILVGLTGAVTTIIVALI